MPTRRLSPLFRQLMLPSALALSLSACTGDGDTPQIPETNTIDDSPLLVDIEFASNVLRNCVLNTGLTRVAELKRLDCGRNSYLRDTRGLEKLTALEEITNLAFNLDIDTIDVSTLTNLRKLDLQTNELTSLDLSNNLQLEYIDVRGGDFTAVDLTNNLKLKEILTNDFSFKLADPNQLESLTLEGFNNPINVTQFSNLKSLKIKRSNIQTLDLQNLPPLKNVALINTNQLVEVLWPQDLSLTGLTIEETSIIESNYLHLFPTLEQLYLTTNAKTVDLSTLMHLKELTLSGQDLSGVDFSAQAGLNKLTLLRGDYSHINFSDFRQLKVLDLQSYQSEALSIVEHPTLEALLVDSGALTALTLDQNPQLWQLTINTNEQIVNYDFGQDSAITDFQQEMFYSLAQDFDFSGLTALERFRSRSLGARSLDFSQCNHLASISVGYTQNLEQVHTPAGDSLRTIAISSPSLQTLNLTALTGLEHLAITDARSTFELSLPTDNARLQFLSLKQLNLDSIDLQSATELTDLNITSSNLASIDVSQNTKLRSLNLADNQLQEINLQNNRHLQSLNLNNNPMECPALASLLELSRQRMFAFFYNEDDALSCGL